MIRVAVSGAAGRMGSMSAQHIAAADGMELVAAHAPGHSGEHVAGCPVTEDVAEIDCDVVVEMSTPEAVLGNLDTWSKRGFHAVVGTSGFTAARIDQLKELWRGSGRCLVVPNFSVGAVLMMRFAETAAPFFGGVEVVELHHDDKPDHPSGTALATAARLAGAGASNVAEPAGRGTDVHGIPVHSIRVPGVVASQEVIFGGPGEMLTIRHDTFSREVFMPGVLTAIRGVSGLAPGVTVGLEPLLGLD